jgi:hypothetical protein
MNIGLTVALESARDRAATARRAAKAARDAYTAPAILHYMERLADAHDAAAEAYERLELELTADKQRGTAT